MENTYAEFTFCLKHSKFNIMYGFENMNCKIFLKFGRGWLLQSWKAC
jgi:hypothetical protein